MGQKVNPIGFRVGVDHGEFDAGAEDELLFANQRGFARARGKRKKQRQPDKWRDFAAAHLVGQGFDEFAFVHDFRY